MSHSNEYRAMAEELTAALRRIPIEDATEAMETILRGASLRAFGEALTTLAPTAILGGLPAGEN